MASVWMNGWSPHGGWTERVELPSSGRCYLREPVGASPFLLSSCLSPAHSPFLHASRGVGGTSSKSINHPRVRSLTGVGREG